MCHKRYHIHFMSYEQAQKKKLRILAKLHKKLKRERNPPEKIVNAPAKPMLNGGDDFTSHHFGCRSAYSLYASKHGQSRS